MAGMMHINLDTPNGVAKARVSGDLNFDQASPILIDSITRTLYSEKPINPTDYASIGLPGIIEHYDARSGKPFTIVGSIAPSSPSFCLLQSV